MASGYTSNGTDLDDLFLPRANAAGSNGGYAVGGSDLAQRYEQRGSTAKISDVGYQAGGSDISNNFMQKHSCNTYDLYFGPGGSVSATWTTCYGATANYDEDTGDPGREGNYATTTSCAWAGTVSSNGSVSNPQPC